MVRKVLPAGAFVCRASEHLLTDMSRRVSRHKQSHLLERLRNKGYFDNVEALQSLLP